MMDIDALETVGDYQFGSGAGRVLFAEPETLSVTRTSSGRPRQIHAHAGRIATYGTDGRLRLGFVGGTRLYENWHAVDIDGSYCVAVGDESVKFVREGRNAFAKFVRRADSGIRPRDEVLLTHDGTLLAVGRAELAGQGMLDFETGVAVSVREGADS